MIALIDYGSGNVRSVFKALEATGGEVRLVTEPAALEGTDKIVLPGVGSFGDAVQQLHERALFTPVRERIMAQVPYLGICLGMQLLFAGSEEVRDAEGFTILPGNVRRFQHEGQKVPHMGWNTVTVNTDCPVFADQPPETFFYFCHSYYCVPSDETVIAGTTTYGMPFASSVWQGTMFGVQFHPEKSQKAGLRVLEKFVRL